MNNHCSSNVMITNHILCTRYTTWLDSLFKKNLNDLVLSMIFGIIRTHSLYIKHPERFITTNIYQIILFGSATVCNVLK